jgi:hypothetical protein
MKSSTMPIVIESSGAQGQRVEHGYVWPDDSTTRELVNAYSALLTAEQSLENSRRRMREGKGNERHRTRNYNSCRNSAVLRIAR